jgi:hypothetical protein
MARVELDTNEWQQVMAILSTAPWRDANPLLMKIGGQLRLQTPPTVMNAGIGAEGNGKEAQHE